MMIKGKTEKLVITGVFLALAIIIPQIFHIFPMANTGGVLLPMHIPVILCGMTTGATNGLIVGLLAPIFSYIITGMPNSARLPFMVCELMIYGMASGVIYRLLLGINNVIRVYVTLVLAMLSGRLAYLFVILWAVNVFDMRNISVMAVIDATVLGIPGIIIQIIIIPVIIISIERVLIGKSKKVLGLTHTFVCRGKNFTITSDKKGIAPIMDILQENPKALKGARVSDRVIGKAAALLLIKGGVSSLYTDIISVHALKILKKSNIRVSYCKKVDYIINRKRDGMCPMENATLDIDEPEEAYIVLKSKLREMSNKQ